MEYLFNSKNLADIPFQKYNQDFAFIVDGKRYQTPRIVADLLSPKVRKLHFTDSSLDEFYISTDTEKSKQKSKEDGNKEDYFESLLQLCSQDQIKLDKTHQEIYSLYFYKLGNTNAYLQMQSDFFEAISTSNVINRLLSIEKLTIDISEEIDRQLIEKLISFTGSHFEQLDKNELKKLSNETLREIIESPNLRITDEDTLLEFILSLYKDDHSRSNLFEFVLFCNVSKKELEKFTKEFDLEDINHKIWQQICDRLFEKKIDRYYLNKSNEKVSNEVKNSKEFKLEKGHEFDGIMKYLTLKSGGNIHDNGTIKISSNSVSGNNYPRNCVDYQNSNYYYSQNSSDVFVCFDFKEQKVQLSSYSIKSISSEPNWEHLRNWVIEVSNDGEKWEEVDRHSNDSTLNGSNITASFKLSNERKEFYRFIRLHQTGSSWCYCPNDGYFIAFTYIEFFGKLQEKP